MGVAVTRGLADVGGGDGDVYAEMVKPETPEDAVRRWGWEERLRQSVQVTREGDEKEVTGFRLTAPIDRAEDRPRKPIAKEKEATYEPL